MLSTISNFFETYLKPVENESAEDHEHCLRLATAALMVEMCLCDTQIDERETETLLTILRDKYELDSNELDALVDMARDEAREATSLYQFTSLFNEHYDYAGKIELIEHLWELAYADGKVDRYEDHLIRKVADLLYVSHSDFIRAKLKIREKQR